MNERDDYMMKFLPAGVIALVLGVAAVLLLRRPRKPRSFREDPVGALKDRSEIVASKAQEATEEALARIQEAIEEIRGRLPDVNRKQFEKRRKQLNHQLAVLGDQAQELLKELRANSPLSR
jgi:hypothetical protein